MNNVSLDEVLSGTSFALFDGAMGTMLVRNGLEAGELPELLCLRDPDQITAIHKAYVDAGSQFVTTNTFGANRKKLGGAARVDEVFAAAVRCARDAGARFVAADLGPTGHLIFPMGELAFSDAYDLFAEQAQAAQEAGADVIIIETMADTVEMAAAVIAAKENSSLPVIATMTFTASGRTFLGSSPTSAALVLGALGVDALGVNCSAGPEDLQPVVADMLSVAACPVIVQANAGLPSVVDGQTVYSLSPQEFAVAVEPMVEAGASLVGGCCGTDPDFIAGLAKLLGTHAPSAPKLSRDQMLERAREAADDDGRDAELLAMILEAHDFAELKEAIGEEYDL